jgi:uncharacterized phiE125 gp8 family phage protein
MLLTLITPPAELPVTLTEAKAHLRVEHTEENALITNLIKAATAEIDGRDGFLRRALVNQTWELGLYWFPTCVRIELPMPPLVSVTHVKYYDADNVEQTFSADNYEVVANAPQGYIALKQGASWPATYQREQAITIRFVAGYGADSTYIPENVRAAMLLRIGELYANRGDDDDQDMGPSAAVRRLLSPSRRVVLA